MAQGSDDCPADDRDRRGAGEYERWPSQAPTAAVARVVLELDEAITVKRRAAAAWLTAHGDAVPLLPIKPSRLELSVMIALVETFGGALTQDARFAPVFDFIAERGAVALVQRVMCGTHSDHDHSDDGAWAFAPGNERLAEVLRPACPAFEFLCGTWPEIFMAQANAALIRLGLTSLAPPPCRQPPKKPPRAEDDAGESDDEDGGRA
ncbi:hypothetical protein [Caballeronia sp. S22]|uniref:hypothetical protein n=1 Tax=Caballeronia sp. S22 TaxID=3137182 RepID=UPI00353085EE